MVKLCSICTTDADGSGQAVSNPQTVDVAAGWLWGAEACCLYHMPCSLGAAPVALNGFESITLVGSGAPSEVGEAHLLGESGPSQATLAKPV